MLSSQEQRVWDDVQRFWAEEVEEPPRFAPFERVARDHADLPVAVGAGARITIVLLLFGATGAALMVAVATAIGWALWHNWPRLSGGLDATVTSPKAARTGPRAGRRTSAWARPEPRS